MATNRGQRKLGQNQAYDQIQKEEKQIHRQREREKLRQFRTLKLFENVDSRQKGNNRRVGIDFVKDV